MNKDTKDKLLGGLILVGGIAAYAWTRGRSGSSAEDVLEAATKLRRLRERYWTVGPACDIQFSGSRDDDEPSTLAELLIDDRDDFKQDVIYPSIDWAYRQGESTVTGVTKRICHAMFPECEWPPPGDMFPDCEWDGLSPFPTQCTWTRPDYEQMLIWMTFYGLVEESCAEGESEGGALSRGSGFICVTDATTGEKTLRPVDG
jgi:hypothetical protein